MKKGVLRGFIPIDPTWKTVSYKRLLTATEKVMAVTEPETEDVQIEEESEVYNMGVLDGFKGNRIKGAQKRVCYDGKFK